MGILKRIRISRLSARWIGVASVLWVSVAGAATVDSRFAALKQSLAGPPRDPPSRREWDNANMHLTKAQFIRRHFQPSLQVRSAVSNELAQAEAALRFARKGPPIPVVRGMREEGYYAANDNSWQSFVRYVPRDATPGAALPLVVTLHGYSPYFNIVNWQHLPETLIAFAEEEGVCVAAPFGRANTDFQGIGEQDVMRVVEEMCARYPIDRDRIILAGHSMGGMGAWTIAAHYPDVFAGLLIIAGRGDYYFWQKTRRDALPPYKQVLVDTEFAFSLLPNLSHLPVRCYHGDADPLIDIAEARHIMSALTPLNPDATFIELPGESHWIEDDVFGLADVRSWILRQRRRMPERWTYTTLHPRYPLPWFLRDTRLPKLTAPVTVRSLITNDVIRLEVDGLADVRVTRSRLPAPQRKLPVVAADPSPVRITVAAEPPVAPATEAAPLAGPIKEAFRAPFCFVSAAPGDDPAAQAAFRARVQEWQRFAKASPRTAHEKDVNEAWLAKGNVFLFGEPEQSPLIRRVLEASPLAVTQTHYVVGERSYPRAGNGLYVVVPSPWNPTGAYAVVQCGIAWGQHLPENHLYDFLPDYIVYTGGKDEDGSSTALCAGFFDSSWQLAPTLMYHRPQPRLP